MAQVSANENMNNNIVVSGSKRYGSNNKKKSSDPYIKSCYEDYVLNNILKLINDSSISDVTFIVENEELSGIRSIFACQSIVFKKMLYGNMMESNPSNHVILNDITINAFKYLRYTFYNIFENKGNGELTPSIVVDVLFAAQKYLIEPLIIKCIEFIKEIENINDWYYILKQFESSSFQYQSKLYLTQIINKPNNAPYILQYKSHKFLENDNFKLLKADTIIILINSDNLAAKEHQIWDALIKWTKHNAININIDDEQKESGNNQREKEREEIDDKKDEESKDKDKKENNNKDLNDKEINLLTQFIKYIRFNQMDATYFKEEIVDKNILNSSDIINIMFARENNTKWKLKNFNDKKRIPSKLMDTFILNEICLTLKQIKLLKIGDLIDFRDLYGLFCPASIIDVDHVSNRIKIHYNNWGSTYDEWYQYSSSSTSASQSNNDQNEDEENQNDDEHEVQNENENENEHENEEDDEQRIRTEIVKLTQKDRSHRIARYGSVTNRKIKREILKLQIEQFQNNTHENQQQIQQEIQVKLPMWFWKKNENYIDNKYLFINKWLNAKIVGFKTAAKYSHHIKIGIYINEDHYEYWIHPDNNDECRPKQ